MISTVAPPFLEWYSLAAAADHLHESTGHRWSIEQVFEYAKNNGWPIFAVFPDGLAFCDDQDKPFPLHSDHIFRLNNAPHHMLSLHGKATVSKVTLPIDGVGSKELTIVHPNPAPVEITLAALRLRGSDLNSGLLPVEDAINAASARTLAVRTNTTKYKREDALWSIIKIAQQQAPDPNNYDSVWAVLIRIAESKTPLEPIVGFVADEGIKHKDNDGNINFLTYSAFKKRLERRKLKAALGR
jgi:hypothetical protein